MSGLVQRVCNVLVVVLRLTILSGAHLLGFCHGHVEAVRRCAAAPNPLVRKQLNCDKTGADNI